MKNKEIEKFVAMLSIAVHAAGIVTATNGPGTMVIQENIGNGFPGIIMDDVVVYPITAETEPPQTLWNIEVEGISDPVPPISDIKEAVVKFLTLWVGLRMFEALDTRR